MELLLTDVNWLAVIVGTVLAFLLGWLWYSPFLFAKKWAEGVRININGGSGPMLLAMIAQIASTFLLAWSIGVAMVMNAVPLAILIGLTASSLIKANGLFSQKSHYAIATESLFVIAMTAVMILVHMVL